MGRISEPLSLYIRGAVTPAVKSTLMAIAQRGGVESRITFLEPMPPWDLLPGRQI